MANNILVFTIYNKNKKQCRKYSMLNSQELSHFSNVDCTQKSK
ncbi:hypothetical protein [Spiroplasma endosymbiont of Polydrusus cervinus]